MSTSTPPPRRAARGASTAPADPTSVRTLLALALAGETSMQDLAAAAGQDDALAAALQRAAARLRPDVDSGSLSQAILAAGLSEVRMVTAAYAILHLLPACTHEDARARVSEGCLRRGALAALIAEERGDVDVYPAFVAGMMAEAGLMWLAARADRLCATLEGISRHPGAERIHAERLLVGMDHATAAAEMAPTGPAQDALREHHDPTTADRLALAVAAADRVAELVDVPAPRAHIDSADLALARAGARSGAPILLRTAGARVLALADILDLHVGRQPDPAMLLAERQASEAPALTPAALALLEPESTGIMAQMDNRARLQQRLEALHRRQEVTSVIVLNFDQFRRVNDTYGVPAGDLVMQSMLEGIRGCLPSPTDRLGRLGGDTFLVLLPGTSSKLGQVTAERIRSLVERNRLNLGGDARIACSATLYGVTLGPEFSPAGVLAELEAGLENARQRSRNRVSWLNEEG